ncbi:hypothetical protein Raf01_52980 [Rugosimonospora africana]|uniref:Uncharacterized protein n=1 Tax=Rugosimonospora africana TaxID=556532 RepID=A0A8J3VSZ5_9ACTN|nr:hypothetical protein Raf01_52980 [Rugosimonospora africana]
MTTSSTGVSGVPSRVGLTAVVWRIGSGSTRTSCPGILPAGRLVDVRSYLGMTASIRDPARNLLWRCCELAKSACVSAVKRSPPAAQPLAHRPHPTDDQ